MEKVYRWAAMLLNLSKMQQWVRSNNERKYAHFFDNQAPNITHTNLHNQNIDFKAN